MKRCRPVVRIKKTFEYAADHVYQAACSALRASSRFTILERDAQTRVLYVEKSAGVPAFMDLTGGGAYLCLTVTPLPDGRCELDINTERKYGLNSWQDMRNLLAVICKLVTQDLEFFRYPRVQQGGTGRGGP